ncbi:hypothetical protein [Dyadobacter sp. MSC1_007]|jgi:hypothetical protein|uniref:hypothetical protein n=1 Tax=Dyadobacter sp. MSC1_007 TaxID=2909264 RepID=UPI00202F5A91|nr:hypothetical protein [Dyadobacter sp. MSC1_007]
MKIKRIIAPIIILLAMLPVLIAPAAAQTYVESDKGYWQVHTDPNSRNTIVQFFDGSNQLLYQETMSKKYIKLNKRNIRQFDELLGKLMARELLSGKVKSYDLVADSRMDFRETTRPDMEAVASSNNSLKTAVSNVYVVRQGKMKVILKDPVDTTYDIRILDDQLRTIYFEKVKTSGYGRWFDMSKLPEGSYSIHINGPRKRLNYKLTVDDYLGYNLEELR